MRCLIAHWYSPATNTTVETGFTMAINHKQAHGIHKHHKYITNKQIQKKHYTDTVYGKTFEGENFRGFVANRESFPLESFAVYST